MAKRKRSALPDAAGRGARARFKSMGADARKAPKQQPFSSPGRGARPAKLNGAEGTRDALAETPQRLQDTTTIQIITGSYERVLHGFTAALPRTLVTGPSAPGQKDDHAQVAFSDTFLFNAHASAIRCLALSPPTDTHNGKILLATGSTDERVNIYSVSQRPPAPSRRRPQLPTLHNNDITQNARNKEIGALIHHQSAITALHFASRSKLFSAAEDSTISISRTRDWVPLESIRVPVPKPQGRPSGDTAGPGEVPSGINDFAVHPSMKLMVSLSRGEKSMRLWNLLTAKKAGVLNFSREILSAAGEGRLGTGEGRRVEWDADGDEFVVAFERGAVVFGVDCKPRGRISPTPRTKLHAMQYLPSPPNTLAVSTEDGRILFYATTPSSSSAASTTTPPQTADMPPCTFVAQLGGPAAAITGRVKDFAVIPLPSEADAGEAEKPSARFLIVTGSSDGSVRLWTLDAGDLVASEDVAESTGFTARQVGTLVGESPTGMRITCLAAFLMTGRPEEDDEADDDDDDKARDETSSEDDNDDDDGNDDHE